MSTKFEYIEKRLDEQQEWHSKKAGWNKRRYYFTEILTLVAGGLIPIVNMLYIIPDYNARIASVILGAIVVTGAGINKLYQFQENWINMRDVSETLKREKEFYKFRVGEYDVESEDERNRILVERVENILSSSTSQFFAIHTREHDKRPPQVADLIEEGKN